MAEKGYGWKYTSICLACGAELAGFNKKRQLVVRGTSIGYVCYGEKKCGNFRKRQDLIGACADFDNRLAKLLQGEGLKKCAG